MTLLPDISSYLERLKRTATNTIGKARASVVQNLTAPRVVNNPTAPFSRQNMRGTLNTLQSRFQFPGQNKTLPIQVGSPNPYTTIVPKVQALKTGFNRLQNYQVPFPQSKNAGVQFLQNRVLTPLQTTVNQKAKPFDRSIGLLQTIGNVQYPAWTLGYAGYEGTLNKFLKPKDKDAYKKGFTGEETPSLRNVGKTPLQKNLLQGVELTAPFFIAGAGKKGQIKAIQKAEKLVKGGGASILQNTQAGIKSSIERVMRALKEAKPIRSSQEALYSAERSKRLGKALGIGQRVGGQKGYYAQLEALEGELPRKEYESILKSLEQGDVDNLFQHIESTDTLVGFQKITAKTGLNKLFGQSGGEVPTHGELSLLKNVFGDDFVNTLLQKRDTLTKLKDLGLDLLGVTRASMTTGDLSALLRQGLFTLPTHPIKFFQNAGKSLKFFASPKAFEQSQLEIIKRPTYQAMIESKLPLTNIGYDLSTREEKFMSTIAEKIPLWGRVIKASNRAYSGFLNRMRADIFDQLHQEVIKQGVTGINRTQALQSISNVVGTLTGRGDLPKSIGKFATILNQVFFSPRLMASRINMLNPVYYIKQHPIARKELLKSMFGTTATILSVLGMAKLNGAEVGTDPRSADFSKIKVGNTRYEITGGVSPYIRLIAQMITGKLVSSTTGETMTLGEGYRPLTRTEIVGRFLETKESPNITFITSLLRGENMIGEKFDVKSELAQRFIPMMLTDLQEVIDEYSIGGSPREIPAVFGIGTQTYGPISKKDIQPKIWEQYTKSEQDRLRDKVATLYKNKRYKDASQLLKQYRVQITQQDLEKATRKGVTEALTDYIVNKQYQKANELLKTTQITQTAFTKVLKSKVKQLYRDRRYKQATELIQKYQLQITKNDL